MTDESWLKSRGWRERETADPRRWYHKNYRLCDALAQVSRLRILCVGENEGSTNYENTVTTYSTVSAGRSRLYSGYRLAE